MRSSLLLLFTFFIAGIAIAQPTITSTSEAVPGDVTIYKSAQTTGVALPATGAGLTWDYTGLIDSGGYEIDTFSSPSSTPYASVFPGTNLALNTGSGSYLYFKTTTSDWTTLGIISPGSDTTYYRSGLNEFHFPFTYSSSFIDSTEAVNYGNGVSDSIETVITHQGAGYGTLKIPGHVYTNVLEVKSTTTQRYSILFSFTTTSYRFVTPGVHSFLFQVDLNLQNAISAVKYVTTSVAPPPTSYTFNGNGNWSDAAQWSGGVVPTSPVPSGTTVTISPSAGGSCNLNVPMTFNAGSTLTVKTGAVFNVLGNLTILK